MTNNAGMWTILAWYSQSAARRIWFYGLEHDRLIIEVIAIRAKFLEPSCYWTVINCVFTFRTTNTFGYVMTQLVKHKFLNLTTLHIYLYGFQIAHGAKKCTTCQHTHYHYGLNCFYRVIYAPWTHTYQNIAKPLTRPSIYIFMFLIQISSRPVEFFG